MNKVEAKNYEGEVEAKIQEWNARIELLKISAQDAGSEKRKEYEEEIDTLIADREAVRRGLLRVGKRGETLCSSCADEPAAPEKTEPEEESVPERLDPEPFDVAKSTKKTYGKGD